MKRAWFLPDKYPETGKDWSNSDWSALLIIICCNDGVVWCNDDMTNESRWSLSYFGIRHDVVSVLSSNHFSQQLNNHPTNRLLLHPNMPMINSRTFQSSSGQNTISRPTPKRSGGDYLSGQQVVITNLVSFWWRLICYDFRSMIWSSQTFPFSRNSRPWEWTIIFGCRPFSTTRNWSDWGDKNQTILIRGSFGGSLEWG